LKPQDEIAIDDTAYRFDVAYHESADIKKLFALYEEGTITKEQLLQSISVNKDAANKAIGAHLLSDITETTAGKTLDVRKRELEHPVPSATLLRHSKAPVKERLRNATDHAPVTGTKLPGGLKLKRTLRIGNHV
jgi:hypothetical protein